MDQEMDERSLIQINDLKKEIEDLKHENSILSDNLKNLFFARDFLSTTALELEELPLEDDLYAFIGSRLRQLIGNGFVVISKFDEEDESFKIRNITGRKLLIDDLALKLLKKDIYDLSVPLKSLSEEWKSSMAKNKWYKVEDGLYEILGKEVSKNLCLIAEKTLNIDEIYSIGFQWNEKIYGGANIFLSPEKTNFDLETLQAFINLASVALQRRNAEKSLNETREILNLVTENMSDVIGFINKDGIIEYISTSLKSVLGYDIEFLLDKSPFDLIHPDEKKLAISKFKENIYGSAQIKFETRALQSSGKYKWIELVSKVVLDKEGNARGAVFSLRDIQERKEIEIEFIKNEKNLNRAQKMAHMGNWELDLKTDKLKWSDEVYRIFGITDFNFQPDNDYFMNRIHHHDKERMEKAFKDLFSFKDSAEIEYRIILSDGKERILYSLAEIIKEGEKPICIFGTVQDITDQKRLEEERDRLFNYSIDMLCVAGFDGYFKKINPSWEKTLGWSIEELTSKPYIEFIHPDDQQTTLDAASNLSNGYEVIRFDNRYLCSDGTYKWLSWNSYPLMEQELIFAVARDVTPLKKAEIALKDSLKEKEMLLKEIHHRVKNNLMVISSLLNLQADYIKDPEARGIFLESHNRAKSMAMIHERLYRSQDLKSIDSGDYIRKLVTDLFNTYALDPSIIKLNMDIDDINLDINTVIPLGLIVNELVSNSMKYAFPQGRKGEINIIFKGDDHHFTLIIKDNGIGFPEDLDYKNTDSLGLQLVNNLTHQIDGEIELKRDGGTEFKMTFQEVEY